MRCPLDIPANQSLSCVFTGIQRWEVVATTGKRPKGRHFHSAVLLDHNMYIFGGKCNGYMNDISCLNLGMLSLDMARVMLSGVAIYVNRLIVRFQPYFEYIVLTKCCCLIIL